MSLQKTPSPTLAILANKNDISHRREVTNEEGRHLALKFAASFYEVSAAHNYENIFDPLNTLIIQDYLRLSKEALAEEQLQNFDKQISLQLPSNDEAPAYDRSATGKKSPSERKQTVRRKISAVIFKKRSENV